MARKQRDRGKRPGRPINLIRKEGTTRTTRKSKSSSNISDIYEYQPENNKRTKVTLDVDPQENVNLTPGDGDGEEDHMRARLVGEQGDDEQIDSGDDEEVDSDAAFEESDEERYAGHNLSHKTQSKKAPKKMPVTGKGVRFAEIDLAETEDMDAKSENGEDEESNAQEGDAEDFIDVLDILDGKGEAYYEDEERLPEVKTKHDQRNVEAVRQDNSGDDDEVSEDSEPEEDKFSMGSISDTEDIPEALDKLESFITNLDPGAKRKSTDNPEDTRTAARPKKRRMIEERNEAGEENEFYAQANGAKLDLKDLLAPLASQSANVISLKASTKPLASSSIKTLAAPLPQRTQERLDREAAYEQTTAEVDKWSATMKRIKEAEHLSFPLQAQNSGRISNSELTAKFKPTTELETSIDKLLMSAKMREEDITETEELKMNHLSVEEVTARREELRTMRELLFRAEVKAKRVARIKSKTYRRIKKKERAKLAAKVDENADEDDESVRMKREVERARERATLRHKHTGKWAKAMKAKGELDGDERRQISEMLERGELLKKKIRGDRGSDEEDDSDDSDDREDDSGDISRIKARAFDELAELEQDAVIQVEGSGKGKSIFDMKFMKNAMARDQQRVDKMMDDFVKEMVGHDGDDEAGEFENGDQDVRDPESSAILVKRTGGRIAFRPGSNPKLVATGSLLSDTSSVTLKSTDPLPMSPVAPAEQPELHSSMTETNPWLTRDVATKAPRKKNEVIIDKNSAPAQKSKNKLKKQAKKLDEEKEKARDDAQLELSISDVLTLTHSEDPPPEKAASTSQAELPINGRAPPKTVAVDDSDTNSEVEEQEKALSTKPHGKGKKGLQAFEQRDLVALAFAGDNVVRDFQEAKRREMAEDAPREVDTTLPGWGSWGGLGTRRQPPKLHLIKQIAGVDPKTRADHQKAHVIISEKRDKKAAKYLVKDLPFPYTSKAQFERSLERPLGTEWNTRLAFQIGTLPKVVKKMGTIIDPLEKLF